MESVVERGNDPITEFGPQNTSRYFKNARVITEARQHNYDSSKNILETQFTMDYCIKSFLRRE